MRLAIALFSAGLLLAPRTHAPSPPPAPLAPAAGVAAWSAGRGGCLRGEVLPSTGVKAA